MPRASRSLFALVIAAGTLLGATGVGSGHPGGDCPQALIGEIPHAVLESDVIVLARVVEAPPRGDAVLTPTAYLKGPVSGRQLRFAFSSQPTDCTPAEFEPGTSVIAFLRGKGDFRWPANGDVYVLHEGRLQSPYGEEASEGELVEQLRRLTGQYAVPAASSDEGASIDWRGTILPLGGVLVVLFGVGLALMRLWHRIDPS